MRFYCANIGILFGRKRSTRKIPQAGLRPQYLITDNGKKYANKELGEKWNLQTLKKMSSADFAVMKDTVSEFDKNFIAGPVTL